MDVYLFFSDIDEEVGGCIGMGLVLVLVSWDFGEDVLFLEVKDVVDNCREEDVDEVEVNEDEEVGKDFGERGERGDIFVFDSVYGDDVEVEGINYWVGF